MISFMKSYYKSNLLLEEVLIIKSKVKCGWCGADTTRTYKLAFREGKEKKDEKHTVRFKQLSF